VNYTNQWTYFADPNADSFNPLGSVSPPTTNVGGRTKYDWRGNVKVLPGQTLVLGLEKENESLRTDSTATDAGVQTTTTASRGNQAGYVELQSEFAKRLFIVANIRADDSESFGPHTTWRIAPAFMVPGTETKLKATYGTGFKAPTLVELYVNNPSIFQVANPNLQPETSRGYDLGFEQPLLNGRVNVGVTYFKNDIENLIVNKFDGITLTSTYLNIGQATMSGVESFAALSVNEQLKLRADYTTTVTRDDSTDLGLLRRPGNKSSLTAIWTPNDRTTISATLVHVSSWVDVNRDTATFVPRLDTPAYTTVNLAGSYDLNSNVTVFARADNLFNEQYQVPNGFLRPGLGVYGGLRLRN
jgi:vitamin B12 transporter